MIETAQVRSNSSYPCATLEREARAAFAETLLRLRFCATAYQQADRIKITGHVEHEGLVLAALCYVYSLSRGWTGVCETYAHDLSQAFCI